MMHYIPDEASRKLQKWLPENSTPLSFSPKNEMDSGYFSSSGLNEHSESGEKLVANQQPVRTVLYPQPNVDPPILRSRDVLRTLAQPNTTCVSDSDWSKDTPPYFQGSVAGSDKSKDSPRHFQEIYRRQKKCLSTRNVLDSDCADNKPLYSEQSMSVSDSDWSKDTPPYFQGSVAGSDKSKDSPPYVQEKYIRQEKCLSTKNVLDSDCADNKPLYSEQFMSKVQENRKLGRHNSKTSSTDMDSLAAAWKNLPPPAKAAAVIIAIALYFVGRLSSGVNQGVHIVLGAEDKYECRRQNEALNANTVEYPRLVTLTIFFFLILSVLFMVAVVPDVARLIQRLNVDEKQNTQNRHHRAS